MEPRQFSVKFVNRQRIKNLSDTFLTNGPKMEKVESKASPGGRDESENVTFCTFDIF